MPTPDNGISNAAAATQEGSEALLVWNAPSFRRLSLADAEFNFKSANLDKVKKS